MARIDKTLTDIEKDISLYNEGKIDDLDVLLKIAARVLSVAAELHDLAPLNECRMLVFNLILNRQR